MINNQGQISGFTLVQDHIATQDARPTVIEEYQEDPND